ncbi:hypothetical protein CWR48_19300 [Oceanobacillus arenosus]|uniref:HTH hxlR-type domain-containing protein n=1 Tax=Oceanobacillus arenosus TaxID=1229153 RepID=A0A3D8PIW0_9BACI|nr:winged helix-turn-helix transcriptional regulator [Oceanobacillus arenosus]RDW15179.1 hypothetical protein CWR48_19300 [Oceanobacillus arenosus]
METAINILVGKWKPVILYHLFENETLRFSELQRSIPMPMPEWGVKHLQHLDELYGEKQISQRD